MGKLKNKTQKGLERKSTLVKKDRAQRKMNKHPGSIKSWNVQTED